MNQQVGIIGAGVVGLCTALEAQRQGYDVILIDKNLPGLGSSFGNAGYLATELIDPLSSLKTLCDAPQLLLNPKGPISIIWRYLHHSIPWYAKFISNAKPSKVANHRAALYSLNRYAVAAWKRCLNDIDAEELLVHSGYMLVWENHNKKEEARQLQRYYSTWGISTEILDQQAVAQLEPELVPQVSHALLFPEGYRVTDPLEVCSHLFQAFERRGGKFIQQEVTSIDQTTHPITLNLKESDELNCDSIIVCTGAWSQPLLKTVGLSIPVVAERGYHLTFNTTVSSPVSHVIGSADRKVVLTPLNSGLRIVGISEISGIESPDKKHNYNILKHHFSRLFPQLSDKVDTAEQWVGCRPTLPDSLPVIDRHPKDSRILLALGNQHLGLTQGAVTGELIISQLTGGSHTIDMSPFGLHRF